MPSPVGHALAGIAAGWLVVLPTARVPGPPRPDPRIQALAFGAIAVSPDLDLLVGTHNGPTHGVGAALIVGLAILVCAKSATGAHLFAPVAGQAGRGGLPTAAALRLALAATLAYATHPLLDWMGNDTTPPIGIMALWPFDRAYYQSAYPVFMGISRRPWLPGFWAHNLTAVGREILILAPLVVLVWLARRGWTVEHK